MTKCPILALSTQRNEPFVFYMGQESGYQWSQFILRRRLLKLSRKESSPAIYAFTPPTQTTGCLGARCQKVLRDPQQHSPAKGFTARTLFATEGTFGDV